MSTNSLFRVITPRVMYAWMAGLLVMLVPVLFGMEDMSAGRLMQVASNKFSFYNLMKELNNGYISDPGPFVYRPPYPVTAFPVDVETVDKDRLFRAMRHMRDNCRDMAFITGPMVGINARIIYRCKEDEFYINPTLLSWSGGEMDCEYVTGATAIKHRGSKEITMSYWDNTLVFVPSSRMTAYKKVCTIQSALSVM
jgi:hypothetical protein